MLLTIHELCYVKHRFQSPVIVCSRVRDSNLSVSIRQRFEGVPLRLNPRLKWRRDAFVDEKLNWIFTRHWVGCVEELKLTQVTESVDKVLHLVHHDDPCVIVAVAAQDPQLAGAVELSALV